MRAQTTTVSTVDLVKEIFESYWGRRHFSPGKDRTEALGAEDTDWTRNFTRSYLPTLNGPIAWLPKVEAAITKSVPEDTLEEENEGQWLDADSAFNAIRFLQNAADLLPGEPCIYGTPLGDFVGEFGNEVAKLTSVVSADRTILVGYCLANPRSPVELTIPHGCNRLREEVREFNLKLAGIHGEAMESRE